MAHDFGDCRSIPTIDPCTLQPPIGHEIGEQIEVLTRHRFGVDFEDGIGWNINDERNDYSWSPRSHHHTVKFHAVHLNEPHSHVISLPIVHVCLRSLI